QRENLFTVLDQFVGQGHPALHVFHSENGLTRGYPPDAGSPPHPAGDGGMPSVHDAGGKGRASDAVAIPCPRLIPLPGSPSAIRAASRGTEQLDGPPFAGIPADVSLAREPHQVTVDGGRRAQPQGLSDLPHRWGVAPSGRLAPDDLENLLLPLGQPRVGHGSYLPFPARAS